MGCWKASRDRQRTSRSTIKELQAAGFKGVILYTNPYAINYKDKVGAAITAWGTALYAAAALSQGAFTVDFFGGLALASLPYRGNACKTDYLIPNPSNPLPPGGMQRTSVGGRS